jgi:hypothetical protein
MKKTICTLLLLALVPACSTVTIRDKGTGKISSEPSYQSSKAFFLWGLIGHPKVNVSQICNGKLPVQVQTQRTFLDGFLGVITLGLYYPRSAKVWCDADGAEGSES